MLRSKLYIPAPGTSCFPSHPSSPQGTQTPLTPDSLPSSEHNMGHLSLGVWESAPFCGEDPFSPLWLFKILQLSFLQWTFFSCPAVSPSFQWCADKCLTARLPGEMALVCGICWSPWYRLSSLQLISGTNTKFLSMGLRRGSLSVLSLAGSTHCCFLCLSQSMVIVHRLS